uniref:fibronectin type III domain-containing protein n=1 Tax=Microbispora cellulosiformans TaxID=2614688 RepID=UPI00177C191D|nr:fibronectin type III domain-containing protein [Microbispora cellulosiformans]
MIVPIAVASALLVGAAPAAADGEILSPANGQVIKAPGAVAVSAKTDWYQVKMSLFVEGPSVSRQEIASGGANQTISGSFDPGDAPNGTFTVTLLGEVTQKTYATSTFVLSRPPEAPSGVKAKLKNATTVLVSWARGSEPDLQKYEITSAKAGKSGSVALDSACPGSSCQASLTLPAAMAGQKVDVSVRAVRADGVGGTIASSPSALAYVTVPAPKASASPSATPSPSKRSDHSAVTSPAAKTPKTHPPTTLPNPEPELPKDADSELTLPEATGGSDQTEPVLVPEQTEAPKTTAQSSFLPLSGGLGFGVYVAIAVVLLLIGANLGAWLRRKGVTGDTAGDGEPADSRPKPVIGRSGAGTADAANAGDAATAGGVTTAKSRGNAPARRPAVILATPKNRGDRPEAEADTQSDLDAVHAPDTSDEITPPGQDPATSSAEDKPEQKLESGPETEHRKPGDGRATPARVPVEQVPLVPAGTAFPAGTVVPAGTMAAGAMVSGQFPDRPLRQPEPDVWTDEDDDPYSGRHRDL